MENLYGNLYKSRIDEDALQKEIRLLDDLEFWVEEKVEMRPWPHQIEVLDYIPPKRCRCSNLKCPERIQRYERPPEVCPECGSQWHNISPGPKRIALRFARRTGKSMVLTWMALHTALTNERATILVIGPGESQLDQLFDDKLRLMLVGMGMGAEPDRRRPHELGFSNGSTIRGFCTARAVRGFGAKQKELGKKTAGKVVMIFDEMDYMDPAMFDAAMPIILEQNVDVIVSSTPSGVRGHFFSLCHDHEYKEFYCSREAAAAMYEEWCLKNDGDLDLGPAWDDDTQAHLRRRLTNAEWIHEVEADWGELEGGVFSEFYLSKMFDGELSRYTYSMSPNLNSPCRVMGVDWNKYSVGPEIVGLELDPVLNMIIVRFRENLPKGKEGELTYVRAVEKIIEINDIFKPHWIYCDRGAGEAQIEQLHLHGHLYPDTGLEAKVKGISFSDNIEYFDNVTLETTVGPIKPWMVNNLVKMTETGRIIGFKDGYSDDPTHLPDGRIVHGTFARSLRAQMSGYSIKRITDAGKPIYEPDKTVSDDALDALMLALHAMMINYFNFNKADFTSATFFVPTEGQTGIIRPPRTEGWEKEEPRNSPWGLVAPKIGVYSRSRGLSNRNRRQVIGRFKRNFH